MSIVLESVSGGQGSFQLGPVSLTLPTNKITALIGPNGCGKSTLLNMISGVVPHQGRVSIDGMNTVSTPRKELAKHVTLLPQNPVVPPAISVEQLVHYGRAPHQNLFGMRSSKDHEIVQAAMRTVDIAKFSDRGLAALSGGQRQRAFIAMGLAQDTPYLMLDEPTSFLDVRYQFETLALLRTLTDAGKTCVVVLHDIGQAARYADELVVMKDGQVEMQGAPHNVIEETLLKSVYGISAHVYLDPISGTPKMTVN